jgi:Type I restriction enzyme R protein N terminus (HSDR_N)
MRQGFTESVIEEAALAWLERLGWTVKYGPEIAPGELAAERADFGQVILRQRLLDALARLNPTFPAEALDDAFRKLIRPEEPTLESHNRAFHRMLIDGVTTVYRLQRQREGRGSTRPSGRLLAAMGAVAEKRCARQRGVRQPREGPCETHTFIRPCIELSGQAGF